MERHQDERPPALGGRRAHRDVFDAVTIDVADGRDSPRAEAGIGAREGARERALVDGGAVEERARPEAAHLLVLRARERDRIAPGDVDRVGVGATLGPQRVGPIVRGHEHLRGAVTGLGRHGERRARRGDHQVGARALVGEEQAVPVGVARLHDVAQGRIAVHDRVDDGRRGVAGVEHALVHEARGGVVRDEQARQDDLVLVVSERVVAHVEQLVRKRLADPPDRDAIRDEGARAGVGHLDAQAALARVARRQDRGAARGPLAEDDLRGRRPHVEQLAGREPRAVDAEAVAGVDVARADLLRVLGDEHREDLARRQLRDRVARRVAQGHPHSVRAQRRILDRGVAEIREEDRVVAVAALAEGRRQHGSAHDDDAAARRRAVGHLGQEELARVLAQQAEGRVAARQPEDVGGRTAVAQERVGHAARGGPDPRVGRREEVEAALDPGRAAHRVDDLVAATFCLGPREVDAVEARGEVGELVDRLGVAQPRVDPVVAVVRVGVGVARPARTGLVVARLAVVDHAAADQRLEVAHAASCEIHPGERTRVDGRRERVEIRRLHAGEEAAGEVEPAQRRVAAQEREREARRVVGAQVAQGSEGVHRVHLGGPGPVDGEQLEVGRPDRRARDALQVEGRVEEGHGIAAAAEHHQAAQVRRVGEAAQLAHGARLGVVGRPELQARQPGQVAREDRPRRHQGAVEADGGGDPEGVGDVDGGDRIQCRTRRPRAVVDLEREIAPARHDRGGVLGSGVGAGIDHLGVVELEGLAAHEVRGRAPEDPVDRGAADQQVGALAAAQHVAVARRLELTGSGRGDLDLQLARQLGRVVARAEDVQEILARAHVPQVEDRTARAHDVARGVQQLGLEARQARRGDLELEIANVGDEVGIRDRRLHADAHPRAPGRDPLAHQVADVLARGDDDAGGLVVRRDRDLLFVYREHGEHELAGAPAHDVLEDRAAEGRADEVGAVDPGQQQRQVELVDGDPVRARGRGDAQRERPPVGVARHGRGPSGIEGSLPAVADGRRRKRDRLGPDRLLGRAGIAGGTDEDGVAREAVAEGREVVPAIELVGGERVAIVRRVRRAEDHRLSRAGIDQEVAAAGDGTVDEIDDVRQRVGIEGRVGHPRAGDPVDPARVDRDGVADEVGPGRAHEQVGEPVTVEVRRRQRRQHPEALVAGRAVDGEVRVVEGEKRRAVDDVAEDHDLAARVARQDPILGAAHDAERGRQDQRARRLAHHEVHASIPVEVARGDCEGALQEERIGQCTGRHPPHAQVLGAGEVAGVGGDRAGHRQARGHAVGARDGGRRCTRDRGTNVVEIRAPIDRSRRPVRGHLPADRLVGGLELVRVGVVDRHPGGAVPVLPVEEIAARSRHQILEDELRERVRASEVLACADGARSAAREERLAGRGPGREVGPVGEDAPTLPNRCAEQPRAAVVDRDARRRVEEPRVGRAGGGEILEPAPDREVVVAVCVQVTEARHAGTQAEVLEDDDPRHRVEARRAREAARDQVGAAEGRVGLEGEKLWHCKVAVSDQEVFPAVAVHVAGDGDDVAVVTAHRVEIRDLRGDLGPRARVVADVGERRRSPGREVEVEHRPERVGVVPDEDLGARSPVPLDRQDRGPRVQLVTGAQVEDVEAGVVLVERDRVRQLLSAAQHQESLLGRVSERVVEEDEVGEPVPVEVGHAIGHALAVAGDEVHAHLGARIGALGGVEGDRPEEQVGVIEVVDQQVGDPVAVHVPHVDRLGEGARRGAAEQALGVGCVAGTLRAEVEPERRGGGALGGCREAVDEALHGQRGRRRFGRGRTERVARETARGRRLAQQDADLADAAADDTEVVGATAVDVAERRHAGPRVDREQQIATGGGPLELEDGVAHPGFGPVGPGGVSQEELRDLALRSREPRAEGVRRRAFGQRVDLLEARRDHILQPVAVDVPQPREAQGLALEGDVAQHRLDSGRRRLHEGEGAGEGRPRTVVAPVDDGAPARRREHGGAVGLFLLHARDEQVGPAVAVEVSCLAEQPGCVRDPQAARAGEGRVGMGFRGEPQRDARIIHASARGAGVHDPDDGWSRGAERIASGDREVGMPVAVEVAHHGDVFRLVGAERPDTRRLGQAGGRAQGRQVLEDAHAARRRVGDDQVVHRGRAVHQPGHVSRRQVGVQVPSPAQARDHQVGVRDQVDRPRPGGARPVQHVDTRSGGRRRAAAKVQGVDGHGDVRDAVAVVVRGRREGGSAERDGVLEERRGKHELDVARAELLVAGGGAAQPDPRDAGWDPVGDVEAQVVRLDQVLEGPDLVAHGDDEVLGAVAVDVAERDRHGQRQRVAHVDAEAPGVGFDVGDGAEARGVREGHAVAAEPGRRVRGRGAVADARRGLEEVLRAQVARETRSSRLPPSIRVKTSRP